MRLAVLTSYIFLSHHVSASHNRLVVSLCQTSESHARSLTSSQKGTPPVISIARSLQAHVIVPDEASFNAVEKRFEVEEARGDYTETLDRLRADCDGPGV